jgi:hypothetical protein
MAPSSRSPCQIPTSVRFRAIRRHWHGSDGMPSMLHVADFIAMSYIHPATPAIVHALPLGRSAPSRTCTDIVAPPTSRYISILQVIECGDTCTASTCIYTVCAANTVWLISAFGSAILKCVPPSIFVCVARSPTRTSLLSGRLPIHATEMNYNNANPVCINAHSFRPTLENCPCAVTTSMVVGPCLAFADI